MDAIINDSDLTKAIEKGRDAAFYPEVVLANRQTTDAVISNLNQIENAARALAEVLKISGLAEARRILRSFNPCGRINLYCDEDGVSIVINNTVPIEETPHTAE